MHLRPPPVAGSDHTHVGMAARVGWTLSNEESKYFSLKLMIFEWCSCPVLPILFSREHGPEELVWVISAVEKNVALPQILTSVFLALSALCSPSGITRKSPVHPGSASFCTGLATGAFSLLPAYAILKQSFCYLWRGDHPWKLLELAACRKDYSHVRKFF